MAFSAAGSAVRIKDANMLACEASFAEKPQSGSAIYLSTSVGSRDSQSKSVRGFSMAALKDFKPWPVFMPAARRSTAAEPDRTAPSILPL